MTDDGYRCRECGEWIHPGSRTLDGSMHDYDGLLHWDPNPPRGPWYTCGWVDNGLFRPGDKTRRWAVLRRKQGFVRMEERALGLPPRRWYTRDPIESRRPPLRR